MKSFFAVAVILVTTTAHLEAQELWGSSNSIGYQFIYAHTLGLTFLPNKEAVYSFVEKGVLVRLDGNKDYEVDDLVLFPFVLPEVKQFVERFGWKYRAACGEKLVVTSATRPIDHQPKNSHPDSVHPTGMAVDFRFPKKSQCRRFLEKEALALEEQDELDVTREKKPKHYHVAVFSFIQDEEGLVATH